MEKRGQPVGYCIYCGTAELPLSDEHVVPLSLGGDAVLPKASCPACANITSRFELTIARQQLGPYRVRAGLPTRRPEKRPTTLSLELLDKDGSSRTIDLPPDQHPATLLVPDLPEPTLLVPLLDSPRRSFRMFIALPDESVFALAHEHDAVAFKVGTFEIGSFYSLLAKVCHAGAFHYPGDWTLCWEPLLPDLIVGDAEDYDHLIGGTAVDEFEGDDMGYPMFYRTVAVDDDLYLVAYLKLFAWNHTPTYQVVVGKRYEKVVVDVTETPTIDPASLESLALDPESLGRFNAFLTDQTNPDDGSHRPNDEPGITPGSS